MLRSLKLLPSSSRLLVKTATTTRIVNRQSTLTSKKKPSAILDYAELSKYRLSSLVVLTTGAGFVCAGAPIDWLTMGAACVGTGLCASSASTFNQIIEKDRDARMNRTMHRPMPSGRVTVDKAKAWGVGTGVAGTSLLLATTNPVVAGLGLTNIVLYGGIYTYSKQYTEWNTWIGSLVGAIPPLMGWAAASNGNLLAQEPIALATLLFLWQFPHFFALSWMYKEDYARGGFKMVSLNDVDGKRSAELIFEYSVYMSLFPLIVSACGLTSSMFLIEGTLANSYLLLQARNFYNKRSNANARKVFLCSLWYLPLMLTAFVFHSQIWNEDTIEENIDENDEVPATYFWNQLF